MTTVSIWSAAINRRTPNERQPLFRFRLLVADGAALVHAVDGCLQALGIALVRGLHSFFRGGLQVLRVLLPVGARLGVLRRRHPRQSLGDDGRLLGIASRQLDLGSRRRLFGPVLGLVLAAPATGARGLR